jgi:ATP-dependent RNA helicase DeaD
MPTTDASELLGPELASALSQKGYATLTAVQEAVLAPELVGRDLRISSQTGSGKTLAIGFAVRHGIGPSEKASDGIARPRAVVITPTRELAKQVELELRWLYAPSKVSVGCVTGGSSVRDEFRMLARGVGILVGTPGRLLDHLQRGAVDLGQTHAVVLDEADRMLDLGFRDDLEAILALAPEGHRTHLVSATFPREVEALARRVQTDAVHIQGTPLGSANADIDHVVHLVKPDQRVDALVNLLLAAPGEQVLVFTRTRAEVTEVCEELDAAGFAVDSLSGEMEQHARHRALSAFKQGKIQILVATDVAARGIDHQDIARVVQLEPPMDADTYTHRSGRTGRAGRKGKSSIMVQPAGLPRLAVMLKRARVKYRLEPIPTARSIEAAQDETLFAELSSAPATVAAASEADAGVAPRELELPDERALGLAARLVAAGDAERALAVLLMRARVAGRCPPREVTPQTPASANKQRGPGNFSRPAHAREAMPAQRRPMALERKHAAEHAAPNPGWVRFRVSWGQAQGADARRLLPMLCRRGKIRGSDIGAIELTPSFSFVDVSQRVAREFERATQRPDPRDPTVHVQRETS